MIVNINYFLPTKNVRGPKDSSMKQLGDLKILETNMLSVIMNKRITLI